MGMDGKGKGQLSKLGAVSRNALSLPSGSANCKPSVAAAKATMLFSLYPRNEANNPEIFIAGATAMLANYPEAVVSRVCDPVRGLPSKSKWLPAIAEIRAACEAEMVWRDAVERHNRERIKTRAVLAEHCPSPTEHQRVVDGFGALRNRSGFPKPTPEDHAKRLDQLGAAYTGMPPVISTQDMENYLATMQCPRSDESETTAQ
jgi:hypothetical protein